MNTKRFTITIISTLCLIFNCQQDNSNTTYSRWVGDIEHDNQKDVSSFKACNGNDQILQYFNLEKGPVYKNEKTTILNAFNSKFKSEEDSTQNGMIRIRFIVNCAGKAGRFRVLQSDYNYNETQFNERITNKLLDITKQIEHWEILYRDNAPVDYYMYLIFKITNGQLTEILP